MRPGSVAVQWVQEQAWQVRAVLRCERCQSECGGDAAGHRNHSHFPVLGLQWGRYGNGWSEGGVWLWTGELCIFIQIN